MIKKYDLYKESGIEWMGKIPSHWSLTKNRYGFKKHNNGKNEKDDTPVLSLTTKGVKVKTNLTFGKSTESYIGHQLVEKGDIVFTPRDFDQTPILSDVSKYNGCISNLYIVDKVKKEILNHFVNYYWHGLKYSVNYFKNFSHGIRHSFNRFQFDEIPLLIPPISEQKLISRYLEKKTDHLDRLVERIQKKVELLKERRSSLINHYVTKGLDSNVKMKDSGIKWIGNIPKHWKVKKISILYSQSSIRGHADEENLSVFRDYGVVRRKDFENKNVLSEDLSNYKLVNKGDLVLNKMKTWMGSLGVSDYRGIVSPAYHVLKPNFDFFGGYLHNLLRSKTYIDQYASLSKGVRPGQWDLSFDDFKSLKIILPPIQEQKEINFLLSKKLEHNKNLSELEKLKIQKLNEYRQSLISSIVTGKVCVTESML